MDPMQFIKKGDWPLDYQQFTEAVIKKMKEPGYAGHKSEEEIREAIQEYQDIMQDGFHHYFGQEYGIGYAANNISMRI